MIYNFVRLCRNVCGETLKFVSHAIIFLKWSTILSDCAVNFVAKHPFLSQSVENFEKWITYLSHRSIFLWEELQFSANVPEMLHRYNYICLRVSKNLRGELRFCFKVSEVLRIDIQFCPNCRNFCQVNYSFVRLCRNFCGNLLDFVSEYRKICEVNYSFVRLCKELFGEKLNFLSRRRKFRELNFIFVSQGQHFGERNYSFVRLCWKICSNILNFLSQCRKNWVSKNSFVPECRKNYQVKKIVQFYRKFCGQSLNSIS